MSCGLFGEDPKEVTPPPEAAPVVAGTIVFAGTRPDGPQRLCTVRPDGSQQVCHDDTANAFPGPPSPDHSALAVVIAEDLEQGHRERLATWSPGQPIKPLTPWAGKVRSPIWKPDKSALWIATNVSGFSDIWTVPMDGSDATPFIEHPAGNFEPHVDPTGKRMLFASSRAGNAEIHLRAEDGTITQLTDHRSDDMKPQWAPDGSAMVWISARQGKRRV